QRACGAPYGPDDPCVRSAATQMRRQRVTDLRVAGVRQPIEQRDRADHHARDAEAALCCLLVEERLLYGMQHVVAAGQTFDRHHVSTGEAFDGGGTSRYGDAVGEHCAGAALLDAPSVLRPGPSKVVAQDLEERGRWIDGHGDRFTVDGQIDAARLVRLVVGHAGPRYA